MEKITNKGPIHIIARNKMWSELKQSHIWTLETPSILNNRRPLINNATSMHEESK